MVHDDWDDGWQRAGRWFLRQALLPDPEHVPKKLQERPTVDLGLVFQKDVEERLLICATDCVEQVGLRAPHFLVDEGTWHRGQRLEIEAGGKRWRQYCTQLHRRVVGICKRRLEELIVAVVVGRHGPLMSVHRAQARRGCYNSFECGQFPPLAATESHGEPFGSTSVVVGATVPWPARALVERRVQRPHHVVCGLSSLATSWATTKRS